MADILICEDSPSLGRLLALTFRLEGHDTTIVADGDACLERLAGPVADLLVLDVMLPGRDGLEVLRELRTRPRWDACPVIVLTALGTDEDVWRGWTSGADYYLTKPFDLDQLREVGQRLLSHASQNTGSPTG